MLGAFGGSGIESRESAVSQVRIIDCVPIGES